MKVAAAEFHTASDTIAHPRVQAFGWGSKLRYAKA